MGNVVIDGMGSPDSSISNDGMDGFTGPAVDGSQKEFFHPNTLKHSAHTTINIVADVDPLESVTGKLRGGGNFCVFRKATSNVGSYKLEIFSDNNLTDKICEFSG